MATDGRGQLLPLPWYLRLLAWLKANPIWGLVAFLLACVGVSGLRYRHLEAKQAKAQRKADLAGIEKARLVARETEKAAGTRQVTLDAQIEEADKQATAGARTAADAHATLEDLATKFPPKGPRWPTKK